MSRKRISAKRRTITELRYPNVPKGFAEVAAIWAPDVVQNILELVWEGYDRYKRKVLKEIDVALADVELERDITQELELEISDAMSGFEPFRVQHERYEFRSRISRRGRSPQYDIAFIARSNSRIMWPFEAKVLRTDSSVDDYVDDLNNNYLTCKYAPHSAEAGMLGYLLSGDPNNAFINIEIEVPCKLNNHKNFPLRNHKTSKHTRAGRLCTGCPKKVICHHLILEIAV